MTEIIETTGHLALSLGTFIRERLEVGFSEQPVVSPLFMLVRSFTKRVLLSVFMQCSRQLFTSGHESQSSASQSVPQAALLPMETKASLEGGNSAGGKAEDNLINWASALFEGVFAA